MIFPNFGLNSDLSSEKEFMIADNHIQKIAVGDWVMLVEGLIKPSEFGNFYQVMSIYDQSVGIIVLQEGENYQEVILSSNYIKNNFRKVAQGQ